MNALRSTFAALAIALPAPLIAQDQPFCEVILDLQAMAGDIADASALPDVALPVLNAPEASCGTTLELSGVRSIYCAWPFPYRSDTATQAFEALLQTVTDCVGVASTQETSARVNHPDSYDLRLFTTEIGTLAVSLKDKGSLQETYVFLRVEEAQ